MTPISKVGFFLPLLVTVLLANSLPLRAAVPAGGADGPDPLAAKAAELWRQLPPVQTHFEGGTGSEAARQDQLQRDYQRFLREKIQGEWFAVLTSTEAGFATVKPFQTWKELMDFLLEREALVEIWAYPEAGGKARRIPATELSGLKKRSPEPPTFLTITYRDTATGGLLTNRLEFSFKAAGEVLAASAGYQKHREIQVASHAILARRDARGQFNAIVQWEALDEAVRSGRLPLTEMPRTPPAAGDLLVAFEYEVDEFGNFTNVLRVYRQSEIQRRVVEDSPTQSAQILLLTTAGQPVREVRGFRVRGLSDELEAAPHPVPGQDAVELRVKNPGEPDARKWNVLEFGEPELMQQSALAKFSLISAYLEKKRKEIAVKKSRFDLIAEPIFAGLNIGGGLTAAGFPIGEAARLGYNVTVVPWLIPAVPSVKEMRELFRLITARGKDPQLKTKPGEFLDAADFKQLQEGAKSLTDAEVVEYLQHINDEDLKAMLRLAKMQRIDARVSNLLSIVAGAGKVSGWTDESGFQRHLFNSIYFSVTGEVDIKNIIAVLSGHRVATPYSGMSLQRLSEGHAPQEAWWQFLNFTVDIRAVINTVARVSHRSLADKELKKPFPYAPRMSDVAAYEIRLFGFPFLMFYKRGLLKDDYNSYLHDYAYGLIGATIVEHFSTAEEMDEEIRAGRMVPLGYVRVPDGQGGWKETNLAVFAHRIPSGKRRDKTAIIIYGLKAYEAQSQRMQREYLRFKQLEQALQEGAVIEQVVDAENHRQVPAEDFEPKLHVGAKAGEEVYAPLLGSLQELHRHWQRKSWGLPSDTNEVRLLSELSNGLVAKDMRAQEEDPFLGVDRSSSAFRFRTWVNGKWRVVQMTLIPGQADIERALAKAREGERIEQSRRAAVSEQGEGIVLLNTATLINGRYEIGPLLQDEKGEVIGRGVRAGAKAMDEVFEQINQLPIVERARLQFNHFAATVVELDLAGTGQREKVFLTLEFPPNQKMQRAWINPLSGEREILNFGQGHLTSLATERRLLEIDYGEDGRELASRTYFNSGTREQPTKGPLLEETRTVETWFRDLSQPRVDPHQPLLSKLKAEHVTGRVALDVYGLFPLPVRSVDDQFITQSQFNPYGIFSSATVLDNGKTEGDFDRVLMEKLRMPVEGQERFRLSSTISANQLATLKDLKAQGYKTTVDKKDVLKGLTRTVVFDNAHWGRRAEESYLDAFDGTTSFSAKATLDYQDDFQFGLVPFKTQLRSVPGGALLSEVAVQSYEPLARRLGGVEADYTGRVRTNAWDYRWENPVVVESALRRTTNQFDRFELSLSGATLSKTSGEAVSEFTGGFDAASRTWQLARSMKYRPAIPLRSEAETLSGFGRLIYTRVGDLFESRPVYNADGMEMARRTQRTNSATGRFDLPERVEDDYRWNAGGREARVQTFIGGQPYDTYRVATDEEGRTVVDGLRQFPGLELRTAVTYDGASERMVKAEQFQNDRLRSTRSGLPEQARAEGGWLLPVRVAPVWGLTATQTFVIGGAMARPLSTVYENGNQERVAEWFEGTSIARVSEILDGAGRPKERWVKSLNRGTNGAVPFDLLSRYKISYWGAAGLAEEKAFLRGADLSLFTDGAEDRTFFDLAKTYESPWYTIDPQGEQGIEVMIGQERKAHVLTVFQSRTVEAPPMANQNLPPEPLLLLEVADLRGLFFHKVSRQTIDRAGNILEERVGRMANLGEAGYSENSLSNALARATFTKKSSYRYERGWLVEETAGSGTGRTLRFSQEKPAAGGKGILVNDGRREWATGIEAIQAASEGQLDAPGAQNFLFRRLHSRRELERNSFLPGRLDAWTSWTATELAANGTKLFDTETVYGSPGTPSVVQAVKITGAGRRATKVAYNIPEATPGTLQEHMLPAGTQTLSIEAGSSDFSGSDFVYLYLVNGTNASLTARDASGRTVRVAQGDSNFRERLDSTWSVSSANVRWLPDLTRPEQAAVVNAPAALLGKGELIVSSMHDLAKAGLDIRHVASFQLVLALAAPTRVQVSPLYRLERAGSFIADREPTEFSYAQENHSSRLRTLITTEQKRTEREKKAGLKQSSTTEWNGSPAVLTHGGTPHLAYRHLVVLDSSDTDVPQPLYALSLEDGHLLEHYQTLKWGDSHVWTVVQGFALPQREVFRAGVLDDELAPGAIAYGSDYAIEMQFSRGRGPMGRTLAALRNRITANAFKVGGTRLSRSLQPDNAATGPLSTFNYSSLQDAQGQAEAIQHLPTLAEALLPMQALPWPQTSPAQGTVSPQEWQRVRRRLLGWGELYERTYPKGLIPTSPDTSTERYVDTVQEAALIILAAKLGETGLAKDLLKFYRLKLEEDKTGLHAAYDAEFGTAKTADLTSARPRSALRTAEAQLAIADAAFVLSLLTPEDREGQTNWLSLGRNLTDLVLGEFRESRPLGDTNHPPRGISEYPFVPSTNVFGLTLWPEAPRFTVRSNARAYVLLEQLRQLLARFSTDSRWSEQVVTALKEEEAWLKTYIVPQVERTGVVPMGVFEIQDINKQTTALGVERSTSTEDWLAFLEAAEVMGLPRENTRRWLENLARVHGARVKNIWGLDWGLALLRPDAISAEATARFQRLARRLGHEAAAQFAGQNLNLLKSGDTFPVILTEASPQMAIQTGQGFFVSPLTNRPGWPITLSPYRELIGPEWDFSKAKAPLETQTAGRGGLRRRADRAVFNDLTWFVLITAGFYLFILLSALFWWRFRALREREHAKSLPDPLVPEAVLQRAEERWAKRVLGVQSPEGAEKTRFSNAALEQNFLLQLKAIYRLVLEWRRQENGWEDENDPRLAEDDKDDWLNGLDEFVTLVGLYMRWVIKAGAKDGFRKAEVLAENEDSNHIWSRLVMFLSEYYWGLLTVMRNYNNFVTRPDKAGLYGQISQMLSLMGIRQRADGFDARKLFNFPADPSAMDLLAVQRPGMTLDKLAVEISRKLRVPYLHFVQFVERYKEFKKRENPYPIHPYLIEFAKVMPHFLLMGLGALVWYNMEKIGDSPIVPYLGSMLAKLALNPASLIWAVPLLGGLVLSFGAHFVKVYRFDAPMLAREKAELFLDATLTSLFVKRHSVMPKVRTGRWWNPHPYQWTGWGLRVFGFLYLAVVLFRLETPSFATFLIVKGLLAMLALAEVAAIVLPLASTVLSKFLQDRVTGHPEAWGVTKFLNRLNLTATRPASPFWLTLKYHTQPSVPTGSFWGMTQAVVSYFVFAATFFFVGGFLCQQIFSLWFTDTYLLASDGKLFFGGLLFWNTMYLLRYGLFLGFTGVASMLVTFPLKAVFGLLAVAQISLGLLRPELDLYPTVTYPVMFLGLVWILFEQPLQTRLKRALGRLWPAARREEQTHKRLQEIRQQQSATLGVVYMSGDELAYQKLTPDLLMGRWCILRDKLSSSGLQLLDGLASRPDDATLRKWFETLYNLEKACDATLWHPMQVVVRGETPVLRPELGLNLEADNAALRTQLLTAWHLRRWLVTMMSTAGHSQDTAINLVDIALRLDREGLGANSVFYLIQNKYDNAEHNRPSQTPYRSGELNQRNKLARLLEAVAPGARAYNLQDWTPFGFKAGALTGMDLVHEESLKLTSMLLLDRNATVHDLDALMKDLAQALTDPDLVIVIPGRGTTNTLTSLGQGSQMVEEGHRSFLKGLLTLLGGGASEAVGTGWGNILAVSYGRVLRAMVDGHSAKMPLTSRMQRGSSFAVRAEGLIGFAPHAVGISEDIWAVSQAAHNVMALGGRVKFLLSSALWHKIRETWSHSEWLASFPRWSGGYLQMMHDPIMQRINDFGPQSVFAKEIRANGGRNFLSAPFALLNILLLPLAIMMDVTPFIQILILLWNFGFVMNQILTVHGLATLVESSGFQRLPAVIGAGLAGVFCLWLPRLAPVAPGLILAGGLAGGFLVGVSRWLYTRVRDIILFGPQLVLHTLGQVVRQSLEFVVSGASPEDARSVNMAFRAWAGPREDRPLDVFPNFINLKTVIWGVGVLSIVLNLFALSNLDMLNVLLVLPSLLFSVSMVVGPFILKPRVGRPLGLWTAVPKALGWLAALAFFGLVSLLIAAGGWLTWAGLVLFCAVSALLLRQALRYAWFWPRLRWLQRKLTHALDAAGVEAGKREKLVQRILQQAVGGAEAVRAEVASLPGPQQEVILKLVQEQIHPLLKAPLQGREAALTARNRWVSEFGRSLTLAVFVLLWFFTVPVPGVLVFTAGAYRFSLGMGTILGLTVGTVGFVLLAAWLARFIQWLERCGLGKRGLEARLEQAYEAFHALLAAPSRLTPLQTASTFALFTDAQTYLDQRSYAYARRSLGLIEENLRSN